MNGAVIVAIPNGADPVWQESSELIPHATLLYLGDLRRQTDLLSYVSGLNDAMRDVSSKYAAFDEPVVGTATLGAEDANVILFDGKHLIELRNKLLQNPTISMLHGRIEQFPSYLPHLTLGFPDKPVKRPHAKNKPVLFDKLGLWLGETRTSFHFPPPRPEFYDVTLQVSVAYSISALEQQLRMQGVPIDLARTVVSNMNLPNYDIRAEIVTKTGELRIK